MIRSEDGQSSIELLGLLPLVVVIALVVGQLLAAGAARESADAAAHAGAMALLQGGDPTAAARAAAPGWSRDRLAVDVHGRRVVVRVRPRTIVPGGAGLLAVTAGADAGPPA